MRHWRTSGLSLILLTLRCLLTWKWTPLPCRYEKRHPNIPAHISPFFRVKEGDHVIIRQCRYYFLADVLSSSSWFQFCWPALKLLGNVRLKTFNPVQGLQPKLCQSSACLKWFHKWRETWILLFFDLYLTFYGKIVCHFPIGVGVLDVSVVLPWS